VLLKDGCAKKKNVKGKKKQKAVVRVEVAEIESH
jgi:hypothetical protein